MSVGSNLLAVLGIFQFVILTILGGCEGAVRCVCLATVSFHVPVSNLSCLEKCLFLYLARFSVGLLLFLLLSMRIAYIFFLM